MPRRVTDESGLRLDNVDSTEAELRMKLLRMKLTERLFESYVFNLKRVQYVRNLSIVFDRIRSFEDVKRAHQARLKKLKEKDAQMEARKALSEHFRLNG